MRVKDSYIYANAMFLFSDNEFYTFGTTFCKGGFSKGGYAGFWKIYKYWYS